MSAREAAPLFEGFAVETGDGFVLTVKGLVHPPGRVIAYLRYVPDPNGDRERGDGRYRRVYRFEEQEAILRSRRPEYLVHDPELGMLVHAVPDEDVRVVYDPRVRLRRLAEEGPAGPLQEMALLLARLCRTTAGIPIGALGLSGSLLVDLDLPGSDVDLIVYGERECRAVHRALAGLFEDPASPVRRPRGEELAAIHEAHRADTPISATDFARLQARKVNEGYFGGLPFFVRFVPLPGERGDRYGDPRFEALGTASIRALVNDAREAMFTPCRYGVGDVTFLEGGPVDGLREVVSFRGRFTDQAEKGGWVLARGGLERVVSPGRSSHHRLVVGGRRGDYLVSAVG